MSGSQGALGLFNEVRDRLAVILDKLASVAQERDAEEIVRKDGAETHQKLADRLRERAINVQNKETFKLAVVGEFNTGKSTFINALLDREILSVSWKPSTATKTVLKYGEPERYKVSYRGEMKRPPEIRESRNLLEDLANFTSDPTIGDDEARLKGTVQSLAKQIKEVEVWCLADFLKEQEIDIVDTPGLGAVFIEHREVTYSLIPEVDATMFLFPIDPGISEEDILFLRFVREHIKQIFFVMTKSDYARSLAEREERAAFNQTTIQVRAGFTEGEMGRVYPISARMKLEHQDPSGFPKVVEELVSFLVSSSGVARLEAPLEFAREKWQVLFESTDKDIRDADKSLQTLKDELIRLEGERKNVETAKNEMLHHITTSVQELTFDATDGIENLPILLQRRVENAIDSYEIKQLRKADRNLEVIIKESVSEWVNKKVERFDSTREQLQSDIERDMRRIVERLEGIESQSRGKKIADVDIAYSSNKMFYRAVMKTGAGMIGKAAISGVGAGGVMLGAIILGTVLGTVTLPIVLLVGVPVLVAISAIGGDAFKVRSKLQQVLKDQFKKSLPPPNTCNIYDLVVYGGFVENHSQPGLKDTMRDTFTSWGNQLKEEVEEWVVNQIGSRITQLERSIREKESGRWNREHYLERYQSELDRLRDLEKHLIEIETIVQNMSNGKFFEDKGI